MAEPRIRRLWLSVGAVALGAFVLVMTETTPVGLLPQIAGGLHVSLGLAGLMVLVPGFSAAVSAPLFFTGSGRFNRRPVILVLGLTMLVSNAIVAVAPNFALVLIARMLFGATLGAFWTVVSPVGPKLVGPAHGTRAITIIAAGISGGTVVGLPAGQFLGRLVGWRLTFAIAAAVTLLVVVAQAVVLPGIPPDMSTHLGDLVGVVKRRAARLEMAACAVAFIAQFTAWTYITPFLMEHTHLSSGVISLLYVIYGCGGIVGSLGVGSLFKRRVIGSFGGAAAVVAALLIGLASTGTVPWLAGAAAAGQRPHDRRLPGRHQDADRLRRAAGRKTPSRLDIADLDAPAVGAFLNHLENDGRNSVRTRNARLAAIHSLFQYAAVRHPEHAADIQRVLAIPPKRYVKALITYLTEGEITALLAAPDPGTWTGRRDRALLVLACQTGLRATELTTLAISDVHLGSGAHVSCLGRGRKQRITPLTLATVTVLRSWLAERGGLPADPLFITRRGTPLSRDALERRIAKYTAIAAQSCPALLEKKVSPHVLRHSAAMRLLSAGIDTSVIALWMGHENTATTQVYIHADLALKERAIARTAPQNTTPGRYQPADDVLAFLDRLQQPVVQYHLGKVFTKLDIGSRSQLRRVLTNDSVAVKPR